MADEVGVESWVGYKVEEVPGTAETTVNRFFPAESFKLNLGPELIERKGNTGTLGKLPGVSGKRTPAGKVDTELYASLPDPLWWVLGGDVTRTNPTGSVYTHSFALAAAQPSMTVEADEVVDTRKQTGAKLNKLELACVAGEAATMKWDHLALDHDDAAALTSVPSYPDDLLTFVGATVEIAGVQSAIIENISLEFDRGAEAKHTLNGTAFPGRVRGKERTGITGKIVFIDFPTAEYDRLVAADTFVLVLRFEGENITGAYDKYVEITLAACQYKGGFDGDITTEVITGEGEFEAMVDGSGDVCSVVVQNDVALLDPWGESS